MTTQTSDVTVADIARMIDHSLLHPTLTDADVRRGCELARDCRVATACVKPYQVPLAWDVLAGSGVGVCAVISFPHGNSTTAGKVHEAEEVLRLGGTEVDMVANVGKVLGGDWDYVAAEIRAIHKAIVADGAIVKVIFENDYLRDEHIIRLCEICTEIGVAFAKTSTGYGFVKQPDGGYNYRGATVEHLRLMRKHCGPRVQIKAAGGIRTLDDLLMVRSLGVTRIGATATQAILDEARGERLSRESKDFWIEAPSRHAHADVSMAHQTP